MTATDIVAYTYQAETLCPSCTASALSIPFDVIDESGTIGAIEMLGIAMGIDVMDERSFDSGDFPKVVFADQFEPCGDCDACLENDPKCADQLCFHCGEELI